MDKELIALEQHLWALFDVWKKITQENDQMWYKQLFGQMRCLVADRAQKHKPILLRLFDKYNYHPTVIMNTNSPRPMIQIDFEKYLDETHYSTKTDEMKKPVSYSLSKLLYEIASNDSTSHEKPELPGILKGAQINWGNSRFDIILFTNAASRTIVCGLDFLLKLEKEGKYKISRDWPYGQINKIRERYWPK